LRKPIEPIRCLSGVLFVKAAKWLHTSKSIGVRIPITRVSNKSRTVILSSHSPFFAGIVQKTCRICSKLSGRAHPMVHKHPDRAIPEVG
jgi:hypothetical protein